MADLELREISKQFDQQFAVRDINLHVQNGELVVLLGPSGCGKSTLMRLIAGLETPTNGQVLIGGQDKTALRPKDRNVALVFQSYALYPHLSIYENIAFPLRVRGMTEKAVDEKVLWASRLLDIERLLQRKPRQTSGGFFIGRTTVQSGCQDETCSARRVAELSTPGESHLDSRHP
jgi:ABC-type sugar transport system ATPase subunit